MAAQQEIDPEIGDQHREERRDAEPMEEQRPAEPRQGSGMQGQRINQQRNERPHLLGIPAPIASPRHIGPDGADEDTGGEAEDGRIEHQPADGLQLRGRPAGAAVQDDPCHARRT